MHLTLMTIPLIVTVGFSDSRSTSVQRMARASPMLAPVTNMMSKTSRMSSSCEPLGRPVSCCHSYTPLRTAVPWSQVQGS